ncbi:MAG TPA: MarR family transcriptional regulator [Dongiaceae bacterium]|jgi:DNA-binding MarR family transcriptional regulator|nr:MarR family transcriptional regulator [Dongiaceae bacterium]
MARKPDQPSLALDEFLCFAVYSLGHAFNRAYKPLLGALGLTYPQYVAMVVLWEHDGITVTELGERLHLDSGTLTPLLKRLEAGGLVQRARDPEDERQVRIRVTKAGQALKDQARAIPAAMLCATGQSAPDLRALKDDLLRLRDQLNKAETPTAR